MKAWVLERYSQNPEEAFSMSDLPEPTAEDDECIIRVSSCALNHIDIWQMLGNPYKPPVPHVQGSDICGVVERADRRGILEERGIREGDEVVVLPGFGCGACKWCSYEEPLCPRYKIIGARTEGGFAQLVKVPAKNVFAKPKNLDHIQACAFPLTLLTVVSMFRKAGDLRGKRVFVSAGASGLGVFAIQLALLSGASQVLTSTRSEGKAEKLRKLGADVIVVSKPDDLLNLSDIDVVFDWLGGTWFEVYPQILGRGGKIVFCGTTAGPDAKVPIRTLFAKGIELVGSMMGTRRDWDVALKLVESGKVEIIIDTVFDFLEFPQAVRRMLENLHVGKIVIDMSGV